MSSCSEEPRDAPARLTLDRIDDERTMRREIPQRGTSWARGLAAAIERTGITPNMISSASVLIAAGGCAALVGSGWAVEAGDDGVRAALLIVAALAAPLRLLMNMLDGMVAVEGGRQTPVGDLFNEVPDRVADVLLLAGAGYAIASVHGGLTVGWVAAVLALLTAYVRSLGAAQGLSNHFEGPMAKPRRMWLLMLGCLLSLLEPVVVVPLGLERGAVLGVVLAVIAAGSLATVGIRLHLIGRELKERAASMAGVGPSGPSAAPSAGPAAEPPRTTTGEG